MYTLCIHYTLAPNRLAAFRAYVKAELDPIRRSGGNTVGYLLPTDFAGPTNEAYGWIDFPSLKDYEAFGKFWRTIRTISEMSPGSRRAAPFSA